MDSANKFTDIVLLNLFTGLQGKRVSQLDIFPGSRHVKAEVDIFIDALAELLSRTLE